jgi:hypothetical protein
MPSQHETAQRFTSRTSSSPASNEKQHKSQLCRISLCELVDHPFPSQQQPPYCTIPYCTCTAHRRHSLCSPFFSHMPPSPNNNHTTAAPKTPPKDSPVAASNRHEMRLCAARLAPRMQEPELRKRDKFSDTCPAPSLPFFVTASFYSSVDINSCLAGRSSHAAARIRFSSGSALFFPQVTGVVYTIRGAGRYF